MTSVFVPSYYALDQIEQIITAAATVDQEAQVVVADTFADFREQIDPQNDHIVLYSLDCFASMIDLLDQVRGLHISSLNEPWFTDPEIDKVAYLEHLYDLAVDIHRARTHRGLNRAVNSGKKLGRTKGKPGKAHITAEQVARVEELRRTQSLSLAAACRLVGCSANSYNTYHRNHTPLTFV